MTQLLKILKDEIIHAIPAMIFFVITFNLITLTQRLIERADDLAYTSYTKATIGALLVGKCIIIVDNFQFVNAFAKRPLIYDILWKFFIYALAAFTFWLAEDFFHFLFLVGNSSQAAAAVGVKLASPAFWAILLWILMLFAVYVVASEVIEELGKDKIKKILFGSPVLPS
jgi:hypothetical protein